MKLSKRISFLIVLFVALIFSAPSHASHKFACEDIFYIQLSAKEDFKLSVQQYKDEVVNTKGLRLLLKDEVLESPAKETEYWGFLTHRSRDYTTGPIRKYFRDIIQSVPRKIVRLLFPHNLVHYDLTPFRGLYHIIDTKIPALFSLPYNYVVKKPTLFVTEKLSGERKEPTQLIRMPVIFLTAILTAQQIYSFADNQLEQKVEHQIQKHSDSIDYMMAHDFRFREIYRDYQTNKITIDQARQETSLMFLAFLDYYAYRNLKEESMTLDSESVLLKKRLFSHLRGVISEGVKPVQGFKVPPEALGSISDQQKLSLIKLQHQLYLRYQAVTQLSQFLEDPEFKGFYALPDFEDIQKEMESGHISSQTKKQMEQLRLFDNEHYFSSIQGILEELQRDPYAFELIKRFKNKKISAGEFQYYLQEDQAWQIWFSQWSVLGITKLKKVNGQFTDQPLALIDLRNETLNHIDQRK